MAGKRTHFIYVLEPTREGMVTDGPTAEEARVLAAHFAYLEAQAAAGTLLLAGRTTAPERGVFGIALLEVAGEEEARRVMLADPAVKHGVMRAALHPFRIALKGGAFGGTVDAG